MGQDYELQIRQLILKKDIASIESALFEQEKIKIECYKKLQEIEIRHSDLNSKKSEKIEELKTIV